MVIFRYSTTDAADGNKIVFDGSILTYYYTPYYDGDIELVPAQALAALLNANVTYSPSGEIACVDKVNFSLKLGSEYGNLNGETITMSNCPIYSNGTYFIPADFIDRLSYLNIFNDSESNCLKINLNPSEYSAVSSSAKPSEYVNLSKNSLRINSSLMLVNKQTPLPDGYTPSDLKGVADKKGRYVLSSKSRNASLKKPAFDSAVKMFGDLKNSSLKDLFLSSGYRPFSTQKSLFLNELSIFKKYCIEKLAWEKAASVVAPPGKSEHQTGLAMDLTTKSLMRTSNPLSSKFTQTPQGKWIYKNSWKYGFVIRYAYDKTNITGIIYEPWHLRFVGKPHAEIMNNKKMCLEEYLEYIKKETHITCKAYDGKFYDIFYINAPASANTLIINLDKRMYDISGYGKNGYIVTVVRT